MHHNIPQDFFLFVSLIITTHKSVLFLISILAIIFANWNEDEERVSDGTKWVKGSQRALHCCTIQWTKKILVITLYKLSIGSQSP